MTVSKRTLGWIEPALENHEEVSMTKDPVCGMTVDEKNAPASYEYKGTTYYFCHPGCKTQFERNPDQFLGK